MAHHRQRGWGRERERRRCGRFDIQLVVVVVVVSHVSEVRTQGRLGAASSAAWGTLHEDEDEDTETELTQLVVFLSSIKCSTVLPVGYIEHQSGESERVIS